MWRFFAPHVDQLATACAADVVSDEPFIVTGGPAGGGTTAVPVTMQRSGLLAFAKPARVHPDGPACAAREKIASDLAHSLGLPIAPVMLSRQTAGTVLPPIVCLSYVALPQPRPWGQIAATLTAAEWDYLRPGLAALYAFHAWIDDHDHNWNDGNVLLERGADGRVRMVAIDYSFSLTKAWNPPAPATVRPWGNRTGPYGNTDLAALTAAVDRIEQFPSTKIQAIIGRIPPDFMPQAVGNALVQGLSNRRGEIRALLNLAGAP